MDGDILTLLTATGKRFILRKQSGGSYTAGVGKSVMTHTDYPITCKLIKYSDKVVNGTAIKSKDRKALIAAKDLNVAPTEQDQIVDGSTVYNILDVQKIETGSTVIAYKCQCRV